MRSDSSVLVQEVSQWFTRHGRALPWRVSNPDPWGILVVEVMSQQTPIARVAPTWQAWMERWPTPEDLSEARPAEVIRAWGRMGYPRRALQLREAATLVSTRFGGRVPAAQEELLSLPGVGPYTAAAVMAFAHGERAVVLDTNIRRVLTRTLDGVALPPAHVRAGERTRAEEILPPDAAPSSLWNAAVMELGALVCTARAPACGACPVTACAWREAGYPDNAPARRAQQWAGTDRMLRGAVMAQLREASGPVQGEELKARVQQTHSWAEPSRLERVLAGLLEDSLIEHHSVGAAGDSAYRLPH